MEDPVQQLEANREYWAEWLRRHQSARDMVPFVEKQLAVIEWESRALAGLPETDRLPPVGKLVSAFQREGEYMQGALPLGPEIEVFRLTASAEAVNASGSFMVYDYVSRVGDLEIPGAADYASDQMRRYQELQTALGAGSTVRALVSGLPGSEPEARFETASRAYSDAVTGVGSRSAAASEMRNLIEGVKGELFNLARQRPRENMTWSTMSERLATGGVLGAEHQELLRQEAQRKALFNELSAAAKRREGEVGPSTEDLWARVLDHLRTTLGLVDVSERAAAQQRYRADGQEVD